jgi:hypothetical protein
MGVVYLALLVVGLGVLLGQMLLGTHHGIDAGHSVDHGHEGDLGAGGIVGVLRTLRFWLFFALAAGMSGGAIHLFALASPVSTLLLALGLGVSSGLFASLVFRAAARGVSASSTADAAGRVGRVLVGLERGRPGQVRVVIGGSSVDMMATTDDEELARGQDVLVEEVREGVAHVSRRPDDLA